MYRNGSHLQCCQKTYSLSDSEPGYNHGISYYLTTRIFRWGSHYVLCLLDFLLEKKNGMECFSFLGKFDYIIQNLTSLKQFAVIRTTISVLIFYLFPLTSDTTSWKVSHTFLVGPGNTENQPFSIAVMYPVKQMLTVKKGNTTWAAVPWQINVTAVGGCLSVPWSQRKSISEKSIGKVAKKHQWGLWDREIQPGYESIYNKETWKDWWEEHRENADYLEVMEIEKMQILIIVGHGLYRGEWHEKRTLSSSTAARW